MNPDSIEFGRMRMALFSTEDIYLFFISVNEPEQMENENSFIHKGPQGRYWN